MKLELDKNSERPIYQQIVDQTLEMIRNGELVSGEKLPTERELKQEYHISAGTVKAAYKTLARMNKVVSVQGSGTYVTRSETELEMRGIRTAIDHLLHRAFLAEIREDQVRDMLEQEIDRFKQRAPHVRVAWVTVCEEMLQMAEVEMAAMPLVQLESFKLREIEENPALLEHGFDLIVTTERYYGALCRLVPGQRDRVYQTSLTMSRESVYQIYRMDAETPVMFWCLEEVFEQTVKNRMIPHHRMDRFYSVTGKTPRREELTVCPVLVVPAKSTLAGHGEMLEMIQEAAQSGVKVIYINYELDRGSVLSLRSLVRNTWSEKCRSGFCMLDDNLDFHRLNDASDSSLET